MKGLGMWSWVFSLKTYAALLLTLFIAFSLDLERPYWAALTVYIVAQPLSGALRSKALYRMLGTVLGILAGVVLIPNLVNMPEVLSLALASWIGLCLYVSLLDRSPRSYVFMLAGYSISFLALPAIADPGNTFSIAVARAEEIGLAILCTTVVDSVIFPMSMVPMVKGWISRCDRHVRECTACACRGQALPRAPLAAELGQIMRLADGLAYDPSRLSRAVQPLHRLHARILLLLPALSSVEDRVRELGRLPSGIPDPIQDLLDQVAAWALADDAGDVAMNELRWRLRAARPHLDAASDWPALITATLLQRLNEVVELVRDCRALGSYLERSGRGAMPRLIHAVPHAALVQHADHTMAAWSGLAAALTIALWCAAWIGLAWPDGGTAMQMAAIACCFFAVFDDPAPIIRSFAYQQIPGFIVGLLYLFVVLPQASGFEMMALALAPLYLLAGAWMTVPSLYGWGMALAECTTMSIGYQNHFQANFAATVNADIAVLLGIGGAALITSLVRSVAAARTAERLMSANRRELAAMTRLRGMGSTEAAAQRNHLTAIMLDRLSQMVPRLAGGGKAEVAAEETLARLRVGLNVVELQRLGRAMPPEQREAVIPLLDALGVQAASPLTPPPSSILDLLDNALRHSAAGPKGPGMTLALVGIRRGLFPDDPPYRPALSPVPCSRPKEPPHDI